MLKVLAENLADAEERVFLVTHKPNKTLGSLLVNWGEVLAADLGLVCAQLGYVASHQETQVVTVEHNYTEAA